MKFCKLLDTIPVAGIFVYFVLIHIMHGGNSPIGEFILYFLVLIISLTTGSSVVLNEDALNCEQLGM